MNKLDEISETGNLTTILLVRALRFTLEEAKTQYQNKQAAEDLHETVESILSDNR